MKDDDDHKSKNFTSNIAPKPDNVKSVVLSNKNLIFSKFIKIIFEEKKFQLIAYITEIILFILRKTSIYSSTKRAN